MSGRIKANDIVFGLYVFDMGWHERAIGRYMSQDAEALRSSICLLLENKKQNMFASKNNLESMKFPWIHKSPWIHKEKGSGIHQKIERQMSEFYWLNNCSKNVYRLRGLFKDSVKLDRQKNIF